MKMSRLYMPTLREVPAEAETPSHQLLLRGGFIRKAASGVYSFLPLGQRVVSKIENIVREEMDNAGSQEIHMSALQPKEIWEESGRWKTFGPEMFKLTDRHEREFCLGPTAEEYFTDLIKHEIRSYKQLPLNLYQIQWKYRDEKRPRFGINRSREFLMKDAYSFDIDENGMRTSYQEMWNAYEKVFDRIGIKYRIVSGDSGAMGGNESHEFIALSEVGEGVIAYCDSCSYSATDEKAGMSMQDAEAEAMKIEEELAIEKIETPNQKTIEEVSEFLGISPKRMIKVVCLNVEGEPVFVFVPGERELNLAKLVAYLSVPEHEIMMMEDEEIKKYTDSEPGFIGPIGIKEGVRLIFDRTITERRNLVCGANESGCHIKNVNYGRDFKGEVVNDLRMVKEGDSCPNCGGHLSFARGIEVGNIFQLGTKYSVSMDATFLDENGKRKPFIMGSYGIGITRTVSAIIEQNYDEHGIIWPTIVAPYEAVITVANVKDEVQKEAGERIYEELQRLGIEALLDDRKERAGVKFNDRDLIGIPHRITVGKKIGENIVEVSTRKEMQNNELVIEEAIEQIIKQIEDEKAAFSYK